MTKINCFYYLYNQNVSKSDKHNTVNHHSHVIIRTQLSASWNAKLRYFTQYLELKVIHSFIH